MDIRRNSLTFKTKYFLFFFVQFHNFFRNYPNFSPWFFLFYSKPDQYFCVNRYKSHPYTTNMDNMYQKLLKLLTPNILEVVKYKSTNFRYFM